ncbi:MAG TPA: dTDP-4-dehydrorhamnose reductase [Gemmataceae bacterium]|nr:dTDP-4-dehydrorhamnose reductase [Gemmataceae bacterium]
MKIAVLGALGQLGRDLVPRLGGEVVPVTRADIDLTRPETISPALDAIRPAVLVNCAAYNFVDRAETEPDTAFAVNAWGVRELARGCAAVGCKLVHFSTDYVFGLDSSRTEPLAEDDPPGPVSVYGLSKLAGEYLIRATLPDHLIIRTCGLYGVWGTGGKGGSFVETMLRVAGQGKPLRVVNDQRCTPSYTADVAEATAALIRSGATGLFHVTSGGFCTWYELAAEVFRQSGVKADLTPIATTERKDPARRPAFSVLSNAKLASAGVAAPRPWPEALAAYLLERKNRSST